MSKIYEALQNAYREKKGEEKLPEILTPTETPPKALEHKIDEQMLTLYKNIETLLPYAKQKTLQFIGSRPEEGTSTIAREFARITATQIRKSVLLLDADRHHATQRHFFAIQKGDGWIDALVKATCVDDAIYQIGKSKLYVSPSCNSSTFTPEIFDLPRFESFWSNLRDRFDLILVDSPPLTVSPDGLAIASRVDGVILVLEADKTRWQTAKSVKDSITRVGGKILGVVLNKRRYYIPQSIYNLL
jgi:capsular exopolysaccharide synthesis family protein